MSRFKGFALTLLIVGLSSACAMSFRSPRVADLRENPSRYQNRTVSINGIVTTSWSVPLSPIRMYKVDDGTGEVTVLSQGFRTPARGAHVRVKGRVDDLAVVGGQAFGLHLTEKDLYVKR
jgi:hypothetical protein